jgi:hypothetical protein
VLYAFHNSVALKLVVKVLVEILMILVCFGGIDVSLSGAVGYGIEVQSFCRTVDFLFCCCAFQEGGSTNIQVVLAMKEIDFGRGRVESLDKSVVS